MKYLILTALLTGCSFSIQTKSFKEALKESEAEDEKAHQEQNQRWAARCIDSCKPYRVVYFLPRTSDCVCEVSK